MDIERVDRFRLAVSAAGDYSVFSDEIQPDVWDYANRALPKLIASGKVFGIRSRLGQPDYEDLVMPDDGINLDVAEDLAADTITRALKRFEKAVLLQWDGRRESPAVLGSYFINLCAMVFPGPFRTWQRHTTPLEYFGVDPQNSMQAATAWNTTEAVIYDIEFERHIELIENPLEQAIVRLNDTGYTDRVIAEVLDLSTKAVEYRLKKNRIAARTRRAAERAADERIRGNSQISA